MRFSIKEKVLLLSGTLVSITLIISIVSQYALMVIGAELKGIAKYDIPISNSLTDITIHQLEQAIHFERVMHLGNSIGSIPETERIYKKEKNKFQALSSKITSELTAIEALIDFAVNNASNQESIQQYTNISNTIFKVKEKHSDYSFHSERVFVLFDQKKQRAAGILGKKVISTEDELELLLDTALKEIEEYTANTALTAEKHEHTAEIIIISISIMALMLGLTSGVKASNYTSNMVHSIALSLHKISEGDLSEEIASGDESNNEISAEINTMKKSLSKMIRNIEDTSKVLSDTSSQLADDSVKTEQAIQEQQQNTQEVTRSMDNMHNTIQHSTDNIQAVSTMANQSSDAANEGSSVVDEAIRGVNELSKIINDASAVIASVEQDSENINTVLEVIKGIAEQTNLLALNAAIEAARAGEQGRGFAVVADEVRTLAVRTQESTAEINQMIETLNAASKKAVLAMNQSQQQANTVVDKAKLAGSSLSNIVQSVSDIDTKSEQLAHSTSELSSVSKSIKDNIEQSNVLAAKNATSSKHLNATSTELSSIANKLKLSVNKFKYS